MFGGGAYSLGNFFSVCEINMQVLPTAPSPSVMRTRSDERFNRVGRDGLMALIGKRNVPTTTHLTGWSSVIFFFFYPRERGKD